MANLEFRSTGRTTYLPTFDGWRAIGILVVLLNHDRVRQFGYLSTTWVHQNGRRGVDLFFALSGLLICARLLQEEQSTGSISLRSFYIRRLFRIQPAALTYLAVISLLMAAGLLYKACSGVLFSIISIRNYFPSSFNVNDWYTDHFWSLSIEEHFYLLLPVFLVCVRRRRLAMLSTVVVLLELWKNLVFHHPRLQFGWDEAFHTDMAVDGILLACVGALLLNKPEVRAWCKSWLHPYVTISAMILALWRVQSGSYRSHFITELALLCVYPLVIASTMLHPLSLPSRLLETPPLRFLGRISYSLYLWQMIFFTMLMGVSAPQVSLLTTIQHSWLRYPCALLAALSSYYLIEKPFIRIGHKLARSSRSYLPTEVSAE